MKKKFKIITLGCKTNQYESQALRDQLQGLGLVSSDDDNVDICIINACSVTKNADKKSLNAIKFLKKNNPEAQFYITGCLCKKIAELMGPDAKIVPNHKKHDLVSYIFPKRIVPKFHLKQFENHTRAFVKIHDGCDSYCTYCVIPHTRGRSKSRDIDDILFEISKLVDNGYQEIVLTGINLGKYNNSGINFASLLREIETVEGLKRIKISSIEPPDITDEVIEVLNSSDKFLLTLHLVLQSGSDKILKKMNRKYSTDLFLDKTKKLLKLIPDFTFTTDVIVGFPYETDEDFEMSLKIVKDVQFQKVHIFPYSKRPNTPAAAYKEQVNQKIVNERKNILHSQSLKVSFEKRKQFVGREMRVLFEETTGDHHIGYTQNNLLVKVAKCEDIFPNSIYNIKLTETTDADYLLGELCK